MKPKIYQMDVKVDIWDTVSTARMYKDYAVITYNATKWANNNGTLAKYKYRYNNAAYLTQLIKAEKEGYADYDQSMDLWDIMTGRGA